MAIKRYLIAPSPYQKRDAYGNPKGPVKAMVTQGMDPKAKDKPVPARYPASWYFSNTSSSNLPPNACTTYLKVSGGRFDGVKVYLASTPETFNNQTEQNTSAESPVGSLQPVITFNSTGARTLTFQFQVFGDFLPPRPTFSDKTAIRMLENYNLVSYCKFLQQLALPTQSGNGNDVAYNITPPIVSFYYGGLHIKGIYKCDTSFGSTVTNGYVDRATVSITIVETEKIIDGEVFL